MANLKEIRVRISSVVSTRQITSAMKMVAAAKLKKAQEAITNFRPYAQKMQEILVDVATAAGHTDDNVYAEDRDYKRVLIVVITSNRGLCGAFNSNAVKEALRLAETKYSQFIPQNKIRYMAIGKKGYDLLQRKGIPVDEYISDIYDHFTYDRVVTVAQSLMDAFVSGHYDSIDIVYNEFVNAAVQKVAVPCVL